MKLSRFGRWVVARSLATLRVSVYVATLSAVIAFIGLKSVHDSTGEAMLSVGRQLAQFEDLTGTSYRVRLNGEPVNVASTLTDAPIPEILDRLERSCLDQTLLPAEQARSTGVLRRQSDHEGLVACIVRDERAALTLGQRLARFGETLDLGDVGRLRYVYAKKTRGGRTHVLTAWTDGAFRLGALISDGRVDAAGSDTPQGARPAARRWRP